MKKLFLVLVCGVLMSTAAFADHEGLGIGITGGGTFSSYSYSNIGLSLKLPSIPVFWGIHGNFLTGYPGLGLTADYYIIDKNLLSNTLTNEDGTYNFILDWYLGVGAFFNMFLGDDAFMNIGIRIPIGLSWHIIRQLELAFGIAPGIGFSARKEHNPFYYTGSGEFALRYWITN
jgi:hypothetical protein